jgi:hydroxypyruvate reductase
VLVGNNARAVDAGAHAAERLGYAPEWISAVRPEGSAESVGRHLASMARHMRGRRGPDCLVSGGEPVVTLVDPARRGLGGRNQQLVLAALAAEPTGSLEGACLLSGGTDGEDGPTDAAGAWADAALAAAANAAGLAPGDFLRRNDAYHFFEPLGALVRTGPTHTNVGDIRVLVVDAAR